MPPNPSASPEPVLELFDDAVPAELFRQACAVCQGTGWYFGHGSNEGDGSRFWKMDLEGNAVFDAIWEQVRPRCEALVGAPLRVIRQYANGHTYGLGGRPHADDHRPGTFTLLYYPMPEWKEAWEGETVYLEPSGEIMFAAKPRPNRGLFFDSRIAHAGRAPSRSCSALRVTVAYKLEVVRQAATPAPEAAPGESTFEEIGREGATRSYRLRVPAVTVDAAVAEQLASLAQTVRLPGFRPGQIPADVLQQRYAAQSRRETVERLTSEGISRSLPKGSCPAAVELKSGATSGDLEVEVTATYLAELEAIDFSKIPFERLTLNDAAAQAAGLKLEEAASLLRSDLKAQVLDRLDATWRIPMLPLLVERELRAIWKAVEAAGEAPADAKDRVRKRDDLRPIAERRLRLGFLVTELARRAEIRAKDGPELEDNVIDHIVSLAQITQREATEEELRDLARG